MELGFTPDDLQKQQINSWVLGYYDYGHTHRVN